MKSKTIITMAISLILFAFLATTWAGTDQDLQEIRKAIKEKGAKWEAGDNWVFRLSKEERKNLMGDLPVKYLPAKIPQPLSGLSLPDSFDWRSYNGYNWTTSIKNQLTCGNCWAHASCGALETVVKITLNEPNLSNTSIDLSELYMTSCSGRGCELGWDQSSSLQFIKVNGVPDQVCFPGNLPPAPCGDTCSNKYNRSIFIEDWYYYGSGVSVDSNDVNAIKDRIYNHGPVTVHFLVYEDFGGYQSGVYEHTWGDPEDWHAVSMVGWNDVDSCWICKNSWGPDWGDDGWFRIRMIHAGVHIEEECWYMTVDSASIPRITVTSPVDGDKWMMGTQHDIKWISPYFSGYVRIDYSTNGGSDWDNITESTLDDGSFNWVNIPDIPSSNCKLKISDASDGIPWVLSRGAFFIVTLGDVNADGGVGIADVVYLVNYVLRSGPEPYIMETGDVNCDWLVNMNDIVFLVNYILRSGPKPEC